MQNQPSPLNEEYIDLLHKNAALIQKPGFAKSVAYKELQKELLAVELKMPSDEMLLHHKIAFPNSGTY